MTEFVVQLDMSDPSDSERLTSVLDALANWCDNFTGGQNDQETPEFMMTTVHTGKQLRRRLIFSSQEQADQFMSFWQGHGDAAHAE